jgi:transposase-like protein
LAAAAANATLEGMPVEGPSEQRPGFRSTRLPIDARELRRLYVGQGLPISATAAALGCCPSTLRRRLIEEGIRRRPRGPQPRRRSRTDSSWTPELAYAVGLIATDGNLSLDGRHLTLVSSDLELLETAKTCLGLTNRIHRSAAHDGHVYRLQWGDRGFYDWLLGIGLSPAKSLTLGPLAVPAEHFHHFLRGCIDGDGSIVTYLDHYNTFKNPAYVYARLFVSLVSASSRFIDWVRATVRQLRGLAGHMTTRRSRGRHDLWRLRYAKKESAALLQWLYPTADVPCLVRKRDVAAPYLIPHERPPRHGAGRPMVV